MELLTDLELMCFLRRQSIHIASVAYSRVLLLVSRDPIVHSDGRLPWIEWQAESWWMSRGKSHVAARKVFQHLESSHILKDGCLTKIYYVAELADNYFPYSLPSLSSKISLQLLEA